MVGVAQLVRAPDCGSGGRGFETRHSPHTFSLNNQSSTRHPFSVFELLLKKGQHLFQNACIGSIWLGVWRILSAGPKTSLFEACAFPSP
jgi:hypothetical protein